MNDPNIKPLPRPTDEQIAALQRQVSVLLTGVARRERDTGGISVLRGSTFFTRTSATVRQQAMPMINAFDAAKPESTVRRHKFSRSNRALRPEKSRFRAAGVEEIRLSAGSRRSFAAQTRLRPQHQRNNRLRHFHAAVRTKIRLRRNFFPATRAIRCAALCRR